MLRKDLNKLDLTDYKPIKEVNKEQSFLKLMRKLPLRIIMTQVIYQTIITVNQSLAYHHLLEDHYSSMYTNRPWTVRQYAGFSTAKRVINFTKKI
ncbi:MAG: hypothetical protein CM15mP36_12160 [Flavobacteriales bacterium]|nr:MAG: hypothetical protein CM15mP36_12160 [Flavobacteriales bacterium]